MPKELIGASKYSYRTFNGERYYAWIICGTPDIANNRAREQRAAGVKVRITKAVRGYQLWTRRRGARK